MGGHVEGRPRNGGADTQEETSRLAHDRCWGARCPEEAGDAGEAKRMRRGSVMLWKCGGENEGQ
jgi:hypothetical protein